MSIVPKAALRLAVSAMAALCASHGVAATSGDVLVFPQADGGYRWHPPQDPGDPDVGDDWQGEIGADLFGTLNSGRLSGLAEVLLSTEEQEVERLQVGWAMGQNTLWLGRFHNPVGYWNTECHHGAYFQSTIERPALAAFEDDSGVVPMHATGVLLQGYRSIGQRGLSYDIALGLGPEYDPDDEAMEALNVLRPGDGDHDYVGTARFTFESEPAGQNRVGVFASAADIPVADTVSDQFEQMAIGAFAAWDLSLVRVTAEVQHIRTRLDLSADPGTARMTGGYVQVEYELGSDWVVYGRGEKLREESGPSYLALVPEAIDAGVIAGLRYRFLGNNQLKLEVGRLKDAEERFGEVLLQWSAVLP
jgi:hypothetical protein